MACKAGQLTASASGSQDVTSVGFKPKAIIFWGTNQTSNGTAANRMFYVGMTSGSAAANQRVVATVSTDNVATSECKRFWGAKVIAIFSTGADTAPVKTATLSSFNSDGFTIAWSGNATQYLVNYLAIAGDNLTNVELVESTMNTGTGVQNYDIHTFQPDFCFLTSANSTSAIETTDNNESLAFGAMKSATERSSQGYASIHGATMSTTVNATCIANSLAFTTVAGNGSIEYEFDFSAWRSLGFALNQTSAAAGAYKFASLAFKGGSYTVVSGDQKTTTATPPDVDESITMGTAFTSEVLFAFWRSATSFGTIATLSHLCIGAASSTDGTQEVYAGGVMDDVIASLADSFIGNTKVVSEYSQAAGGLTLTNECDMKTFGSTAWTVRWTTSNTAGRFFSYVGISTGTQTPGGLLFLFGDTQFLIDDDTLKPLTGLG